MDYIIIAIICILVGGAGGYLYGQKVRDKAAAAVDAVKGAP